MDFPFLALAIGITVLLLMPLYRVVVSPDVFNRIIGAGLIGTKGLLLLVILGFVYGRMDMFTDIAIIYALLNFIVTIAAAKYLERKGEGVI